jgi:hypothetical protein
MRHDEQAGDLVRKRIGVRRDNHLEVVTSPKVGPGMDRHGIDACGNRIGLHAEGDGRLRSEPLLVGCSRSHEVVDRRQQLYVITVGLTRVEGEPP